LLHLRLNLEYATNFVFIKQPKIMRTLTPRWNGKFLIAFGEIYSMINLV